MGAVEGELSTVRPVTTVLTESPVTIDATPIPVPELLNLIPVVDESVKGPLGEGETFALPV